MKIDRIIFENSSLETPPDCKALILKLKACNDDEELKELSKIKTWNCEKWMDVLNKFDHTLEISCKLVKANQWCLPCDGPNEEKHKKHLLNVLQFTALLIKQSFFRHIYNSMEHLTTLLLSSDMNVVLAVLNILYVFSKRSDFITRLNNKKQLKLLSRLLILAESWGGKENGFSLAECCQNLSALAYPPRASTLHFEYYAENICNKPHKKASNMITTIHIDNIDKMSHKSPSQIMEELVEKYSVPKEEQMQLFTHIRLAYSFSDYPKRMLCVKARLQALSVLVHCKAVASNVDFLLHNDLIEELVDVLELQDNSLIDIKAAALKTLTSILHLDWDLWLSAIIDATGAASYLGFLPVLVRSCIQALTEPDSEPFPLPFASALFSFIYHLSSCDKGRKALVSSSMVEDLLKVINWDSTETKHISIVSRSFRSINSITNVDKQAFLAHGGVAIFIRRLEMEVNVCRRDQPFVINPKLSPSPSENQNAGPARSPSNLIDSQDIMEIDSLSPDSRLTHERSDSSAIDSCILFASTNQSESKKGLQCFPQRAALLKLVLQFLKKNIQNSVFSHSIHHLMDGSLPESLKHIISNPEYYGSSLFLLATHVVTLCIFKKFTLLSSLQDNGLTDVVFHALLVKKVPATREVLASLPNVFSALCMNVRGLQSFETFDKPFEKLLRVFVFPEYLPAMCRRHSSDPIGDVARNLGNAMAKHIRYKPNFRTDATAAIIKLLEELCVVGRDHRYICSRPTSVARGVSGEINGIGSKTALPLVDYILNVMTFLDAFLSKNLNDDHCREFVRQKGLVLLMSILGLPNLPIDFPVTPTCQAVSTVCKTILVLAHEPQVLKQGLLHLNEVLQCLKYLQRPLDPPGGSVLLEQLISAPDVNDAILSAQSTPLLHYMKAAHAYIIMFIHVCRTEQSDIHTLITYWGSDLGLSVLKDLSSLYTSLLWESKVLLTLCSNDNGVADDCQFGRQQLKKLLPKDQKLDKDDPSQNQPEFRSSGITSAMETLSTNCSSAMDVDCAGQNSCVEDSATTSSVGTDKTKSKTYQAQIKQIKPLLSASSRLGRALAELFELLVKLCVGAGQQIPLSPSVPSPAGRAVASALTCLLTMGLSWEPPPSSPIPKFRLTFYICSVGFTSRMLFDERKYPYHPMLQEFFSCGGLDAFFKTFHWALTWGNTVNIEEGFENSQLPVGTSEFLDAWLMLLEKMVNPKNVLESPHTLPPKHNQSDSPTFNPVLYLIHIHKRAFESIMYLWNRKPLNFYGERIADSMLAVICHLLKGETIIKEKLSIGEDTQSSAFQPVISNSASSALTSRIIARNRGLMKRNYVNQDHLTLLIDMGFYREIAIEALLSTNSLERAIDYILSISSTFDRGSSSGIAEGLGMEWEMSVGEVELVSTNQVESKPNNTKKQELIEFELQQEEPLSTHIIDDFTSNLVDECIQLADVLPNTVYRCCDLLISVAARNGEEWRNKSLIDFLVQEMHSHMLYIIQSTEDKKLAYIKRMALINVENRFGVCLHVFALIFEKRKFSYITIMECSNLLPMFIRILDIAVTCLIACPDKPPTQWLPYLLLLLNQYEKASVMAGVKAPSLMVNKFYSNNCFIQTVYSIRVKVRDTWKKLCKKALCCKILTKFHHTEKLKFYEKLNRHSCCTFKKSRNYVIVVKRCGYKEVNSKVKPFSKTIIFDFDLNSVKEVLIKISK